MNNQRLRRAIAQAFPDQYRWWRWRHLLDPFVNDTLRPHTTRWLALCYQHGTFPDPDDPATPILPLVMRRAMRLLARRRKLSYGLLSAWYIVQLHQLGAMMSQVNALRDELSATRRELADTRGLLDDYKRLSEQVVDELSNISTTDPNNRPN